MDIFLWLLAALLLLILVFVLVKNQKKVNLAEAERQMSLMRTGKTRTFHLYEATNWMELSQISARLAVQGIQVSFYQNGNYLHVKCNRELEVNKTPRRRI